MSSRNPRPGPLRIFCTRSVDSAYSPARIASRRLRHHFQKTEQVRSNLPQASELLSRRYPRLLPVVIEERIDRMAVSDQVRNVQDGVYRRTVVVADAVGVNMTPPLKKKGRESDRTPVPRVRRQTRTVMAEPWGVCVFPADGTEH